MCHAGELVYMVELERVRMVKVLGDDKQLSFKLRLPGYEMETTAWAMSSNTDPRAKQ